MLAAAVAAASVTPAHAAVRATDAQDFLDPHKGPLAAVVPQMATGVPDRQGDLRAAAFNVSLHRGTPGALVNDLDGGDDAPAQAVAEIIQRSRPDVVLLSDFDYDAGHEAAALFRADYLNVGQNGQEAVDYPYIYTAPSNPGIPSGADLDKDGTVGGAADAFGLGDFPGQHGMVLYSKYPILVDGIRTFPEFLWKDMPENSMPTGYYTPLVRNVLRLSSSSHWDVPVRVDGRTVHVLAAHPAAPALDGAEKRNVRRNHDEIRLLSDYVAGGKSARYIRDDAGKRGGLPKGAEFVVLGDLNADPQHGRAEESAVEHLLESQWLTDPLPASAGGAATDGTSPYTDPQASPEAAAGHDENAAPRLRTADIPTPGRGPLRTDYALPSKDFAVEAAGVFWPAAGEAGAELVTGDPSPSGNHRLVWVDVSFPAQQQD
jgi:hypothetical protein